MENRSKYVLGFIAMFMAISYGYSQYISPKDSLEGAAVHEIENPQILGIIKEPAHKTPGVGMASCGPGPLPQYIIYVAPAAFTYKLKLL